MKNPSREAPRGPWWLLLLATALPAAGIVPGCDGNVNDDSVFTLDLLLVSRDSQGVPGESSSHEAHTSNDGRFVVFSTFARNLDPRDTDDELDVFIRDTSTGLTSLVSVAANGLASGNEQSGSPKISPNGRFVAFWSLATDLVTGVTDTNDTADIFVRDLNTGVTVPVSVDALTETTNVGASFQAPAVISDANNTNVYVVFASSATDLVFPATSGQQIFLRRIPIATFSTVSTGTTFLVSTTFGFATIGGNSFSSQPTVGQDATQVYVAWESFASDHVAPGIDTNAQQDVFWRSVNKSTGALGATSLISIVGAVSANDASRNAFVSENGAFVAFESDATNLVVGDTNSRTDIFVRGNLLSGPVSTTRASLSSTGIQGNDNSFNPSISANGQSIVFESDAVNLVAGDTNSARDVFLRNLGTTSRVALTLFGAQPIDDCTDAVISGNGRAVVFESFSSGMVPGTSAFGGHVYRRGL